MTRKCLGAPATITLKIQVQLLTNSKDKMSYFLTKINLKKFSISFVNLYPGWYQIQALQWLK
jgi:hypothetical protein